MNKNKLCLSILNNIFFILILTNLSYIYSEYSEELDNSGNWYEKLHWWLKARPEYEQVGKSVEDVKALASNLLSTRTNINKQIEQLYNSIKVTNAQAINNINKVINELKPVVEDVDQGDLSSQAALKQKELELLKEYFETLNLLHKKLEHAYNNTIKDQVSAAEAYQDKALDYFDQIQAVFDDEKALYLYESIKGVIADIKEIAKYLKHDLNSYINQLTFQIRDLMSSIERSVRALEQNGILIRPLTKQEIEQQELEKAKLEQQAKAKAEADRKAKEEQQKQSTWWGSITGFFSGIYKSIFG